MIALQALADRTGRNSVKLALLDTLLVLVEGAPTALVESVMSAFSQDALVYNLKTIMHPKVGVLALELSDVDAEVDDLDNFRVNRFTELVLSEISAGNELVIAMHAEAVK